MAKHKKKKEAKVSRPTVSAPKNNKLFLLHQRYELKQILAKDATTITRLARDIQTRRDCMIHEMSFQTAHAWEQIAAFEKRAKTLQHLHNDGLPRMIEFFTEENQTNIKQYLVMQFIQGEPVGQFSQPWHEPQVIAMALPVLEVLASLHGFSPPLIHGALSPNHIIRRSSGSYALIGMELLPSAVKTAYQPPEYNKGVVKPTADIYALGMTLIMLLAHQESVALLNEPQTFRAQVPMSHEMARILAKMIAPAATHRYQKVAEVQSDLLQLQQRLWHTSAQVVAASPPELAVKPVTWQPYWVASFLTLLVIGIVAWGQHLNPPQRASQDVAVAAVRPERLNPQQAVAYWKQANYRQAYPLYAALSQQNPTDIELLFRYGYCAMESKEYEVAMTAFQRILNRADNFYTDSAMFNLGWLSYLQEKYAAALSWYNRVEPHYKNKRHMFLNNRGLAYTGLGQYGQAIRDYQEAIRLKPDYKFSYNSLGQLYLQQRQFEKALHLFNQGIAVDSAYALPHFNKGEVYRFRQQWELAVEEYTTAITLVADYPAAYIHRAQIYGIQKKYPAALTDVEQAIAQDPHQGEAYFIRGQIYAALKQCKQAQAAYLQACQNHYDLGCQAKCEDL